MVASACSDAVNDLHCIGCLNHSSCAEGCVPLTISQTYGVSWLFAECVVLKVQAQLLPDNTTTLASCMQCHGVVVTGIGVTCHVCQMNLYVLYNVCPY